MARVNRDNVWLFYEHGVELSTKTIYIGSSKDDEDDVGAATTADTIKSLHLLSSIRPLDPISIIINNQGGDVQHGLAIYDYIRSLECPVHITIYGHCYSIAAWILQAADVRRMSVNSSLMVHEGESVIAGNPGTTTNWYKFYTEVGNRMSRILLERIRQKHPEYTESKLNKLLINDTILMPEDALRLGLIDEIV